MQPITEDYKKELEGEIVDCYLKAWEEGVITEKDTQDIAHFTHNPIQELKIQEEVKDFLKKLVEKWPFMESVGENENKRNETIEKKKILSAVSSSLENKNAKEALAILGGAKK